MGTTNHPSTDTPVVVPDTSSATSTITVSGLVGNISDLTVDIDVTAIDEGGGPDPALMFIDLTHVDSVTFVDLHDGTSDSIVGVNFDDDRSPASGAMSDFNGLDPNSDWDLFVSDDFSSGGTDGSINSWTLNITVPDPVVQPPQIPTSPDARTIPTGLEFGSGDGQRRNVKLTFALTSPALGILDAVKLIPFKAKLLGLTVQAVNPGSAGTSKLSLVKVSGGTQTTLVNQTLRLNSGTNFSFTKFSENFNNLVEKDDVVYVTLDEVATDLQDITVTLTVQLRD